MMKGIKDSLGNIKILELPKIAFFCSRKVPADVVLKCYDWAIEQREKGRCVVSGFHSTIEKDVLHYLLKGDQPIVIALHRGIGPEIKKKFTNEVESGRLLIISPFDPDVRRGDKRTAATRNRLMMEIAEGIVVGHATPGGELDKVLRQHNRPMRFLNGSETPQDRGEVGFEIAEFEKWFDDFLAGRADEIPKRPVLSPEKEAELDTIMDNLAEIFDDFQSRN